MEKKVRDEFPFIADFLENYEKMRIFAEKNGMLANGKKLGDLFPAIHQIAGEFTNFLTFLTRIEKK